MILKTNFLNIETTTRCTLKCPACSRTWWNETLGKKVPIHDIDIEQLYNFLNCATGKQIKMLDLRGDWGDCIYYPKLFDFIDKFRKEKIFRIVTNGSRQTKKFWNNLASRLGHADTLEFSIDGLEDTNHLYRRNSDWQSLMTALDIIGKSKAKMVWRTRVFSFNENILDKMEKFANDKGAVFQYQYTHRFGDASLKPKSKKIIDKELEYNSKRKIIGIVPRCRVLENASISAYNMFMPCEWFRAPQILYKSDLWKQRQKWMIKDTTLDELMQNVLLPWADSIEDNPSNASILCQTKCRADLKDRKDVD